MEAPEENDADSDVVIEGFGDENEEETKDEKVNIMSLEDKVRFAIRHKQH